MRFLTREFCCVAAGKYLEIFARKNNLRDYWVSVGNEVTGARADRERGRGGARRVCALRGSGGGAVGVTTLPPRSRLLPQGRASRRATSRR